MVKTHVTFIVSQPLYPMMCELEQELSGYCHVIILLAESNQQVFQLYEQNWQNTDVFIFSGKVFLYAVTEHMAEHKRPCFAFDDMAVDIREIMLQLLLKDREFDFSRVFVDIAYSGNDYLGLRELLPPHQWPYILENIEEIENSFNLAQGDVYKLTEAVLQRHIMLHQKGQIDLSITRFGAIISQLTEMGLPNLYLKPSKEYIINFLLQVLNSINQKISLDRMIGSIALRFPDDKEYEAVISTVAGALLEYAGEEGLDFSLHRERELLIALTQYKDLETLSQNFHDISFKDRFIPHGSGIFLGLGSGKSMFQAKRNAVSALEISRVDAEQIYYVSQENKILGPIGRSERSYTLVPTEEMLNTAQRFHLDHMNLQKIIAYARLSNSTVVTADALSTFLGVTLRSANRLLSKVVEGGGAKVYEENISSGRGRPKKYYELTFINQL